MEHVGDINMKASKAFARNLIEKNLCNHSEDMSKETFLDLLDNYQNTVDVTFVGELGKWMVFLFGTVYAGDPIKEKIVIETMWIEPLYNKK